LHRELGGVGTDFVTALDAYGHTLQALGKEGKRRTPGRKRPSSPKAKPTRGPPSYVSGRGWPVAPGYLRTSASPHRLPGRSVSRRKLVTAAMASLRPRYGRAAPAAATPQAPHAITGSGRDDRERGIRLVGESRDGGEDLRGAVEPHAVGARAAKHGEQLGAGEGDGQVGRVGAGGGMVDQGSIPRSW